MGLNGQYQTFLERKAQMGAQSGFEPNFIPDGMFDFQQVLLEWAVQQGRGALFVDTGAGKTYLELAWAQNVYNHTGKPVLILTPLAVAAQTVREGEKFGIECVRSNDGAAQPITVTNYQKLHYFDATQFAGIVCDESSVLKSFDGATKAAVTEFMRQVPYRLLATATPSPNDHVELGTSSEALGYLGYMDMLNRFFKNDQNSSATNRFHGQVAKWRFKGHAELPFWRWVSSWARAMRKPSDLGFDDGPFQLPPLTEREHVVTAETLPDGTLFAMPAVGLKEQREERRRTIRERCEQVAELVDHDRPALVWCHLNDEADLLEEMIPDAQQVAGSHRDDVKEERLLAFANDELRVLVTKPKIGAWGLNLQNCSHVTFFPSHSFEQYYQGVRRCWRFGQTREVVVDIVSTEGEKQVMKNLRRKAEQANDMFEALVREMHRAVSVERDVTFKEVARVPDWLPREARA